MLSYCLRERGELTKKTLESIISQALNSLLPSAEEKIILDTGDNMVVKLLSHKEIYDKVKELAEGMPNIGEDGKEHSFYSPEYNRVSDKKISKICRDKFHAKDDYINDEMGTQRALRFNPQTVKSIGKILI